MGFPSPAKDFEEHRISLDEKFIHHPSATYFMRAGSTYYQAGIIQGALLVIDASLSPCDGSLLVCAMEENLR
jgi:DNA polymerase V